MSMFDTSKNFEKKCKHDWEVLERLTVSEVLRTLGYNPEPRAGGHFPGRVVITTGVGNLFFDNTSYSNKVCLNCKEVYSGEAKAKAMIIEKIAELEKRNIIKEERSTKAKAIWEEHYEENCD